MFVELLKQRVGPFEDVTLEGWIETFGERFELIESRPVPNTPRTLLFMRKK